MQRTISPRLAALGIAVIAIVAISLGAQSVGAGSATAGWPAAKAQRYDQQRQALADARANPRPKPPETNPAAAAVPAPTRQAGIVAMHQGPFSSATFLVRNFWQGPVGSDWLLAYAGAEPAADGSAPRGAIRVYTQRPDLQLDPVGTFPAPTGIGPLTIVAAGSDVLQLRADDGTALSFDLRTDQYR